MRLRNAKQALAAGNIHDAVNELLEYAQAQMTNPEAGAPEDDSDFEQLFETILEQADAR